MKIAIGYTQIVFFLAFGLISGAVISTYVECKQIQARNAVYLSLPPEALTQIKI